MHDEESGLVYNRAGMLHPGLGRFMQHDPLEYVDGMSLYEYLASKPTIFFDPTGTMDLACCKRDLSKAKKGELVAHLLDKVEDMYRLSARFKSHGRRGPIRHSFDASRSKKLPCLTPLRCTGKNLHAAGFYEPATGRIRISAPNVHKYKHVLSTVKQEFGHAIGQCRKFTQDCDECMQEEIRVRVLAKECNYWWGCTKLATESCASKCRNRSSTFYSNKKYSRSPYWPPGMPIFK